MKREKPPFSQDEDEDEDEEEEEEKKCAHATTEDGGGGPNGHLRLGPAAQPEKRSSVGATRAFVFASQ